MHKTAIALLIGPLLCSTQRPAAADCAARLKKLAAWTAPAAALLKRDAFATGAGVAARLVAAPDARAKPPGYPAATVEVRARDFAVDSKPVSAAGLAATLRAHPNVSFARSNPRAVTRGIVLAVHRDAPASNVKVALDACKAIGERQVWLAFALGDAALKPPPRSAITARLDAVYGDVGATVGLLRETFAPCPPLMKTMSKLGGMLPVNRLPTLLREVPVGLRRCKCAAAPADVASILWTLGLRDLVTTVALPVDRALELATPADAPWTRVAPRLISAAR